MVGLDGIWNKENSKKNFKELPKFIFLFVPNQAWADVKFRYMGKLKENV